MIRYSLEVIIDEDKQEDLLDILEVMTAIFKTQLSEISGIHRITPKVETDYQLNAELKEKKVPKCCYEEFGNDLDGCSRQSSQGCGGCICLE
jgi:hypothetical protein